MILFGSPFQAIFFLEKFMNIISTGKKWIGTNFSALRISITSHLYDFHLNQKYVHSSNKLLEVLSPQVQVHFHSFFAQCVSIGFLQISISSNDTIQYFQVRENAHIEIVSYISAILSDIFTVKSISLRCLRSHSDPNLTNS